MLESNTQPLGSANLGNIMDRDNINKVVPIISNSFYINEILCNEQGLLDPSNNDQDLTVDERLTRLWAKSADVNYPLDDGQNLSRVAQYYLVDKGVQKFPVKMKRAYLKFLKSRLLEINKSNEEKEEVLERLSTEAHFSEIVTQLGYTKSLGDKDPLQRLAILPFSNYITTSYYDFIERALVKADKAPVTQFLRIDDDNQITAWSLDESGEVVDFNPTLIGTPKKPVVYHLFGMENDAKSLAISEDDYINFLVAAITDTDTSHPMLPLGLTKIISSYHLLLLGYQLQDWDFRVLFRLVLHKRSSPKPGIFMQIPRKKEVNQLLDYLSKYFKPNEFDVEWKSPIEFTQKLWEIWEGQ